MRSETGEAALNLAALGWQVLPLHHCVGGLCSCGRKSCRSQGKHPRTQHGLLDASADLWVVGHWWRRWPHANLAVATGPASGLWVLGPDGEAGVRAALALWPRGEESPHPVVANTGGGGRHYYFAWPGGLEVANRRNHRGLPIDVRGRGGYVVAPPSVNASGSYSWLLPPGRGPLPAAPAWLLEWVRPPDIPLPRAPAPSCPSPSRDRVVRRAISWLRACPPAVSGQGGHGRTLWAVRGVVWGFGLGAEEGFSLVSLYYNPRCLPPWSERELWHKCRDADRDNGFRKPRGWLLTEAIRI